MYKTEFLAKLALLRGEITPEEFKAAQARIATALKVKTEQPAGLKDFVVQRDATVLRDFTAHDLNTWQDAGYYFRYQCLDWAVGEKSFGMIYSSPEEAMTEGSTVLDGKSCVKDWAALNNFKDSFAAEYFCVLVFSGDSNGYGHDGENVVAPQKFIVALDFAKFVELAQAERE